MARTPAITVAAVTAVIPNADAAPAIVNASILPLLFLSGVFIPLGSNAPAWIVWIARIFPVWHFARGMQAGFLGTAFSWTDVLVVAAAHHHRQERVQGRFVGHHQIQLESTKAAAMSAPASRLARNSVRQRAGSSISSV